MQPQSQANKLGEIRYRKIISEQHTGKRIFFKNEPDQKEIKKILAGRLSEYRKTFSELKRRNILKSPFLEIGAEYAIASLLLKNRYSLDGFASDISLYSLTKTRHFAKIFKLHKIPGLLCSDAENLPLKSNSIPFVFAYETLHHFPNPALPLKEIYRILSPGGIFFIGSDPIIQSFQIKLWRRPTRLRFWEKILKMMLILPFVSHIGKAETEYGIIEGAFNLKTWQNCLNLFDNVEAKITIYPFGPSKKLTNSQYTKWQRLNPLFKLGLFLFGGDIQAICYKKGSPKETTQQLICPKCLSRYSREVLLENLSCSKCKSRYLKKNGITILLQEPIAKHLIV